MVQLNPQVNQQSWNEDEALFNLPARRITKSRVATHLVFWTWDAFTSYSAFDRVLRVNPSSPPDADLFWLMYITHIVTTIIFYYGYGYLVVPTLMKLLVQYGITHRLARRAWRQIAFVLAASAAVFLAFNVYDYYLFSYAARHYQPAPGYVTRANDLFTAAGPFAIFTSNTLLTYVWAYNGSYLLLPLLLRIIREAIHWGVEGIRQKELNKNLIENQLQTLQYQINPHFLFNVFNSMLALIQRSNRAAAELLRGLSQLMQYTLYETNKNFVPLAGELQFLQNYVDIEKSRQFNPDQVRFTRTGDPEGFLVPPLLLITYVENAFKHGLNNSLDDPWVSIELSVDRVAKTLRVDVSNPVDRLDLDSKRIGGLGLANARKRLNLLYRPDEYSLHISEGPTVYQVSLTLPLKQEITNEYQPAHPVFHH